MNITIIKTAFIILFIELLFGCTYDGSKLYYDAVLNYKKNNYNQVINDIDKISDSKKLNFNEYKLRGLAYYYSESYNLAILDFKHCFSLQNYDKDILINLGRSYLVINNADTALFYYNFLIHIDKSNYKAINERGVCFLDKNSLKLATNDFEEAIKINPNFSDSYNNLGLVNANLGNYNKAIKYYNIAISKNKEDGKMFYNRGVSYLYLKKTDSALNDLNQAINLDPNQGVYYLNRGFARHILKQQFEACNDWNKALNMGAKDASQYLAKFCKK